MLGERVRAVMASPRSLPSRTLGRIAPAFWNVMVTRPPITSVNTRAAIRNVDDVETELAFEHLAGDVLRRPGAGAREGKLSGLRLGERDQLGDAFSPARRC